MTVHRKRVGARSGMTGRSCFRRFPLHLPAARNGVAFLTVDDYTSRDGTIAE